MEEKLKHEAPKASEERVIAYKGFNSDMTCKGFQYEVGKEYEIDGEIKPCERGFHACENPLDVLDYYSDVDGKYCVVEQDGMIVKSEDKQASSKIKINTEIGFVGLFKLGIEWIKEVTNTGKVMGETSLNDHSGYSAKIGSSGNYAKIGSSGNYAQIGSSGNYAQIGSSGDSAQIGSSGDSAKIGSSGNSAKIGSSGDYAQIGSSGDSAKIGSSGNSAKIGSSGYSAKIGSSGNYAQIGSSGYSAKIGSSGNYAQIGSSGDYAQIGSSGDSAKIGSSGNSAQIGSSGDYAKIGSSGNYAQIGSSGDSAKINSTGEDSVVVCAGHNSTVKAKVGSWITLAEWAFDDKKSRWVPVCVKTERVDGERIKEDTWYKLVNGEFKEVGL